MVNGWKIEAQVVEILVKLSKHNIGRSCNNQNNNYYDDDCGFAGGKIAISILENVHEEEGDAR